MKASRARRVGAPGSAWGSVPRGFAAPARETPRLEIPGAERQGSSGHSFGAVSIAEPTSLESHDFAAPALQLKLITDETALGVFANLLERCSSTADTAPGHSVLPGLDSLPQELKSEVEGTIASVGSVCAVLRGNNPPGFWETKYFDTWRGGHRNDGGWLAAHDIAVVDTGDAARNAYWAASDSRYVELTVTGTWRLLWDVSTNEVYLTAHYEDDGSHSPFFLITGLTF